ncbi:MAG: murein L,D-transpeptidase [Anaerolineaceae bacterium]|nr:MAG: murein L,D-transpeptidase [Anaerolineaceae bacterium]
MRHLFLILPVLSALLLVFAAPAFASEDQSYGVPHDVIEAYPAPDVTQLAPNEERINDRIYRRVQGDLQIFNGPNGDYVRTLDAGFNFVTVHRVVDGWAEIGWEQWVRADSLSGNLSPSTFAGVLLPEEPLPFTMAWLLIPGRPSQFPGGEEHDDNPYLSRYTRLSIYDEYEIDGWRWYQIGVDQWIHQTHVAKIEPIERPEGLEVERWVSVDLYEQTLIAYEGQTPVFATLVSTGLPNFDTREGLFHVYVRYERGRMSWLENTPNFYYLQEVPWIQYFDGMIGLHGVYWHDGFGYRRSRGCVNLSITDADWVYRWADEVYTGEEDEEFAVYVYSSGEYR